MYSVQKLESITQWFKSLCSIKSKTTVLYYNYLKYKGNNKSQN